MRFQRSCLLPSEPDLWEAGWTHLVPHGREWVSTGGVGKHASVFPTPQQGGGTLHEEPRKSCEL